MPSSTLKINLATINFKKTTSIKDCINKLNRNQIALINSTIK